MIKKIVLHILVLTFFLAPCSEADDSIKIGIIFAKTGNAAIDSAVGFETAQFAADEINDQGGLLGKKIILKTFDNKSTPIGSRIAAQKAVKAGVTGVIGAVWSSHSMAMAEVLQKAGISMISPSSTNPEVTLIGDYIFRVCFHDTFQGKVMADFALDHLKAETAVVMTNTNSKYSMGLASFFIDRFQKKGKILLEADYPQNITDFSHYLKKIKSLNPDVAFVPDHYRESAYIIKQAETMGINLTFLGGDGWLDQMYKYGGESVYGNFYAAQWHFKSPLEASRLFVKKYSEKYGRANEPAMALTYDAFTLLASAVKRADSLNRKDIRDALAATKNFHGVTGDITFDKNGDPVNKSAAILKFENHGSVYYKSVQP